MDRIFRYVVEGEGYVLGEITYELMTDLALLEVNRNFLKHDYFTDIITFDLSVGNQISGELLISIDRVRENAFHYNVDYELELNRVFIHGVLHLCGYGDSTKEEKKIMREKEDFYLRML